MSVSFSSFPHFDIFGFIQYQLHTFFQFSIHVRKEAKNQWFMPVFVPFAYFLRFLTRLILGR